MNITFAPGSESSCHRADCVSTVKLFRILFSILFTILHFVDFALLQFHMSRFMHLRHISFHNYNCQTVKGLHKNVISWILLLV